ncbi:MAG TPA: xanthine dehydrogenase family protein molybdopterin-binding subunit [Candidatus Methylomirabilis sp.]|nr:xanthine dehydrogenase family protein molybdopterin-binding subunit [Candidatus Methylomirabilis sp.]
MEGRPPTLIGASVKRVEDRRLLTGRGRFVGDLVLPGMLHAAFLRSPHPHARIERVDAAGSGAVAVFTAADLRPHVRPIRAASRMAGYAATDMPPLASEKVRYVGEAVAVVAAESRYAAEDAVERIAVDYSLLDAVAGPRSGAAAGAPLLHDGAPGNIVVSRRFSQGDVAAAFEEPAVVVGDRFRFHRHAAVAIENRACLADYEPASGALTLWSSTQVPGMIREALADLLEMPAHHLRVVAPDVGGGFGVKSALYPEEVAVSVMAKVLGRPVKWIGDRREDLLTSTQAWDEEVEAELAVSADGSIRGLRATVWADVGAYSVYPWTASIEVIQVLGFLPGPYRVPHYRAEGFGVATNKAPMGPYRGVGRPVSTFVMEGLLDRAARRLGVDPAAIRLANIVRDAELPYRAPSGIVWDSGSFAESLQRACELAGYPELRARQRRDPSSRRRTGIGIASYVELTGVGSAIPASPGATVSTGTEGATVRVDASGSVTAAFGLACHGQGHETTLAQIVADELGVEMERVRVVHGDTDAGPVGSGTYASRSAVIGGGAAILASRAVREKALAIAAHQLEADARDLDLAAGVASVRGAPDRRLTLGEIARSAYAGIKRLPKGMEPGLEATRFYDPYIGTAANATHLAEVEVDLDLGAVALRRYVVVEDCGRIINPMIVEGQAVGGVAQGLGAALLEELVYEGGQLLTGSLMDYLVPTAAEMPRVEVTHIEKPSPSTLGGFKGVGEGGTIGAPAAIANAVADALAPLGIEISELPITPDRLFRLLADRRP